MFSLQQMVDQDVFVCPRCHSPVQPEGGQWRCAGASCRYAGEPFPVISGIPALVDFEPSVLDADRLRAVEGASDVARSSFASALRKLVHSANNTAPTQVAKMLSSLRAEAAGAGRRPRILVVGGGTVGDGLADCTPTPPST